jgi:tRNA(fMet)-specific endonuclease VapC
MTATPKYMLDTNICIYIQRKQLLSVLKKFEILKPGEAVISTITWGELLYGSAKSQQTEAVLIILKEFASIAHVLPIPPKCGEIYGQVRSDLEKAGMTIGNNDLWMIASHAIGGWNGPSHKQHEGIWSDSQFNNLQQEVPHLYRWGRMSPVTNWVE